MKPETMAPRAVVVNDNRTQLRVLAGMARRAGLEAQAYEGAEAALAGMDPRHPPAVVVTDVDMPGIDGWAFCRLLKSKEYAAFNAVPILVGSATFSGEEPERIAADLGVDGFMALPVSEEAFADERAFFNRSAHCLSPSSSRYLLLPLLRRTMYLLVGFLCLRVL